MPNARTASVNDAGNSFNSAIEFSDSVNKKRDQKKNRVLELLGEYPPYHPEGLAGLTSTEEGRKGLKNLGIAIPANLLGLPSDLASIPTAIYDFFREQIEELSDPLSRFIPSEDKEGSLFNLPLGSVDLAESMGGDPESYPFVAGSFLTPDPTKIIKGASAALEGIPLIAGAIRTGKGGGDNVISMRQVLVERGSNLQKQLQSLNRRQAKLDQLISKFATERDMPDLLVSPPKGRNALDKMRARWKQEEAFGAHASPLPEDNPAKVASARKKYRDPTVEEVSKAMEPHIFDNKYPEIYNNDGTLRRFESPEDATNFYKEILQLKNQNIKTREAILEELKAIKKQTDQFQLFTTR